MKKLKKFLIKNGHILLKVMLWDCSIALLKIIIKKNQP